jgi:hypothetical protein
MEQVTRSITKRDGAALYQTADAVWKFADTRSNTQQEDNHPQRFDILTPRGAAGYLGGILSEAALQRHRSEGGGPKFKIGKRRVGYRISDLQAWLDARLAQSPAYARARGLAS